MIKWKSLISFLLTLVIIIGGVAGASWYFYQEALDKLAQSHPEIRIIPESSATYSPNYNVVKGFKELRKDGYSIKLPPGYKLIEDKNDSALGIMDKNDKWRIRIQPKMIRFDETIQANRFIKNPSGDYYILLRETYKALENPILLFQKMSYLPSETTHIKKIKTPNFFGFYIVGERDGLRVENYQLFDELYWHNVSVTIYDENYPHWKIQNIISTLQNLEDLSRTELEENDSPSKKKGGKTPGDAASTR